MIDKDNIEQYFMVINNKIRQLINIKVLISNKKLIDRVLTSLSLDWDIFKKMILGRNYTPTFNELEKLFL